MSEHTPEELHDFAAKHAPKLAEKITQLCGAVIARGMTGILEEVCRIQQDRDRLSAINAELLEALENIMQHIGSENHHPDGEWVTEPIHIDEVKAARAAIAKAQGEQQ